MKDILAILILFISLSIQAQTREDLINRGRAKYDLEDYAGACIDWRGGKGIRFRFSSCEEANNSRLL